MLGWIFAKLNKIKFWKFADIFTPFFALGEGIQRIGCFLNGCCYGIETVVHWAVIFTNLHAIAPKNIPLHPTQIYLSLGAFLIFILLWRKRKAILYDGQIFLNYLIFHSILRSVIENFKTDALYFTLGRKMGKNFEVVFARYPQPANSHRNQDKPPARS